MLWLGRAALGAAAVAFVFHVLLAVTCDLHLFGDGTWWLLRMASSKSVTYWYSDWWSEFFRSRIGTYIVIEAPTLLAIAVGVRSLHALSIIFGFTLYLHAPLGIYICFRYTRERVYLLLPVLSLFAGSMNCAAYMINDSHFVVSLYWPALFILLSGVELKGRTLALLLVLSAPMIASYESMVAFGAILAGVCVWRMWTGRMRRAVYGGLALWYLLSAAFAAAGVMWPFDPANKDSFVTYALILFEKGYLGPNVSAIVLVCTAVILLAPPSLPRIRQVAVWIGCAAAGYMMLQVLIGQYPSSLDVQIVARTVNFTVPLLTTALLFALRSRRMTSTTRTVGLAACLVSALGIAQCFGNMGAAVRWTGMLSTLRGELARTEGPVPYRQSIMSRDRLGPLPLNQLYGGWGLLPLSVYAAENGQVRSLVLPAPGQFLPFDPYSPDQFPNLSSYGINYDAYRKALPRHVAFEFGQTLNFTRGAAALAALGRGWSYPEPWATWSEGQEFDLAIPMAESHGQKDILFDVFFVPHLAPGQPRLTTEVTVNDVAFGRWSLEYKPGFEIWNRQLRIPAEVFFKMNPVRVRFRIAERLKSPTELGAPSDPRKLGLALVKISFAAIE